MAPGTSIHSRDISSEHERSSWLCEPGLRILTNVLSFLRQTLWLVYADLIVQLFILQLSVTLGIMFAYLLGMFVPWRLLAVIGTLPCIVLIPGLFFIPESPRWLVYTCTSWIINSKSLRQTEFSNAHFFPLHF
jgi:hypothetical protein